MNFELEGAISELVKSVSGNPKAQDAVDNLARVMDRKGNSRVWSDRVAVARAAR